MGLLSEFRDQGNPPTPAFTENDVPDLAGKVILITGGNSGIGRETSRVVLARGAKVYIACRSEEKGAATVADLKQTTGKDNIHFIQMNLANMSSIRTAVEEFQRKETRLDVLFNNAGIMACPLDQLTDDGYDMQFGTNVLGHYLLTKLLLPTLLSTAKQAGEARVINTSSFAHLIGPKGSVEWDTLKPEESGKDWASRRKLGPAGLYNQSKCGNVIMSNELARRYGDQGIVSISLNPGNIVTDLGRHMGPWRARLTALLMKLHPVSLGAITQLYAGTAPEASKLNGKYLIPWARVGECREQEARRVHGELLWTWLEEQVTGDPHAVV